MTIFGTVLAAAFLLFIWFLFGWRETHHNSIETDSLEAQSAISISNFKLTFEKEKIETANMNSQNLNQTSDMDIQPTGNSWKSNEISSTQDSDMNSLTAIGTNNSTIQESQSTQDSATIGKKDDSLAGINMRSKSVYFSAQVPSECYLESSPSLEYAIGPKSLENALIDEGLAEIPVEDASSSTVWETGITVSDMTAEMPSATSAVSVTELDSQLEGDNPITEDKIESVHDKELMLQSETETNATYKADLKTEYSITKLRSGNTVSILDTHSDLNMEIDSTPDYMLMERHLSNNYHNSDSEMATTITEATQKKKFDEIATAEEVSSLSGSFVTVDYEPIVTESEAYLRAN
ncbi:hypothetical protein ACH3XW_13960 [Acanthocheilonema viteae]|uniref:Uncharacterized protein n=1 Tax=Acanthocheilonema viteae TaxID=6277 RepID=A0A498S6I4_ACAVI|nr:unnamed protein product [Acanthocheilonema viteae]